MNKIPILLNANDTSNDANGHIVCERKGRSSLWKCMKILQWMNVCARGRTEPDNEVISPNSVRFIMSLMR